MNESDGYCAALPYFLFGYNFNNLKKIISIVTVSKISIKYALAKFYLIDLALKGSKNPIKEFIIRYKKNSYFKSAVKDIEKVIKLKKISGGFPYGLQLLMGSMPYILHNAEILKSYDLEKSLNELKKRIANKNYLENKRSNMDLYESAMKFLFSPS